jgi:molybdopterin-synthase adenylyltransferase
MAESARRPAVDPALESARVLLVGAGGLGCAAARVLVESGVGALTVLDDDCVELSNLQRQTLFNDADVGAPKASLAAERLTSLARDAGHKSVIVAREIRVLPENARNLLNGYDLVLEGADNFATKFLVADACALNRVPLVQAGAVRWVGWALASLPGRSACLRCVFEDMPRGEQDTCAGAGVIGPVVGALGALQAALALRLLRADETAAGELWSYAALAGTLRRRPVRRQARCPLCAGRIEELELNRYAPPECAA